MKQETVQKNVTKNTKSTTSSTNEMIFLHCDGDRFFNDPLFVFLFPLSIWRNLNFRCQGEMYIANADDEIKTEYANNHKKALNETRMTASNRVGRIHSLLFPRSLFSLLIKDKHCIVYAPMCNMYWMQISCDKHQEMQFYKWRFNFINDDSI